jgi:hypothetical protein
MASRERRGLLSGVDADEAASRGAKGKLNEAAASFKLASSYVVASIQRDRRAFCIGVATIAIVVTFAALLQSAVEISPVIFMKLAEDQAGEADVVLTSEVSAANPLPTMNYTAVARGLQSNPTVVGASPRWPLLASVANHLTPQSTAVRVSTTSYILGIDSDQVRPGRRDAWERGGRGECGSHVSGTTRFACAQEAAIGLGRMWNRRALGEVECYASSSLLQEIGEQRHHAWTDRHGV